MTKEFEALLLTKTDAGQAAAWSRLTEADLMEGDVTVRVTHSTVNYKDGLAITGKAPVVRRWPMIPGIDLAGVVKLPRIPSSSRATRWCSTAGAWARPISAATRNTTV